MPEPGQVGRRLPRRVVADGNDQLVQELLRFRGILHPLAVQLGELLVDRDVGGSLGDGLRVLARGFVILGVVLLEIAVVLQRLRSQAMRLGVVGVILVDELRGLRFGIGEPVDTSHLEDELDETLAPPLIRSGPAGACPTTRL